LHALTNIIKTWKLSIDTSPSVSQMRKLPPHPTLLFYFYKLSINRLPWSLSRAPSATYPGARTPDPPPGGFGVIPARVPHELRRDILAVVHQPDMPRVQVAFIDGPISIVRNLIRRIAHRTPKIAQKPVPVVHCLDLSCTTGAL